MKLHARLSLFIWISWSLVADGLNEPCRKHADCPDSGSTCDARTSTCICYSAVGNGVMDDWSCRSDIKCQIFFPGTTCKASKECPNFPGAKGFCTPSLLKSAAVKSVAMKQATGSEETTAMSAMTTTPAAEFSEEPVVSRAPDATSTSGPLTSTIPVPVQSPVPAPQPINRPNQNYGYQQNGMDYNNNGFFGQENFGVSNNDGFKIEFITYDRNGRIVPQRRAPAFNWGQWFRRPGRY